MSTLREQMKINMELKGFSPSTQEAYLRSVRNYALHYGISPDLLGLDEVKQYLHQISTHSLVSSSYINIIYSALKFLYVNTLNQPWDDIKIPRTKKQKKLPVILSPSEIKSLFNASSNLKHKAILMTLYGAGLRAGEAAKLLITDIDSSTMQIRIRQAKGKKDRYTLLSQVNLRILRAYWSVYRPKSFLFASHSPDKPLSLRTIQNYFKEAKERAHIKKNVTPHTLRHCFATHLLEAGANIFYIQHLLGHSHPKTTSIYIHLTRKHLANIQSPLDTLAEISHD